MAQMKAPMGYRDAVLCGRGATSRVYRALEVKTGRTVALKRLHRQLVRSAEALARLRRELESTGRLRHPAIVPVYDVVRWDGDPTIVMRFVEGEDLKERIQRAGALSIEETEGVARALLDVLAASHGAGIVHRDVKPQNIRLGEDGQLYLVDFGSSRLDAASQLTHTGTTIGTPEYMAPELFCGPVYDPRVDIYGAGATLYECLTGAPPQSADSLAELAYMRSERPIPPIRSAREDVPQALAQMIDRSLQIEPEARYPTATLAAWALDNPTLEAGYAARQKRRPLCLHCHTPIPPESGLCPACKSDHPFSFEAGNAHLVIDSIEDHQRFIEFTVSHAPELARPEHLQALTEHAAALSFEKQRYASFIDPKEAEALRKALREQGVHCHIEHPSGSGVIAVVLAVLAVMGAAWLSLGAADMALLLLLFAPVLVRALDDHAHHRASVLSAPGQLALSKPLWPRLQAGALGAGWVLGALTLTGLGPLVELVTFPGAMWLSTGSAIGLGMFTSLYGLSRGQRPRYSPAPRGLPVVKQWARSLLFGSGRAVKALTQAATSKIGPIGQLVVISTAVTIVPLEIGLLKKLSTQVQPVAQVIRTVPRTAQPKNAAGPGANMVGAGGLAGPTGPARPGETLRARRAAQWQAARDRKRAVGLGFIALAPLSALAFAIVLMRRRRRTRADAAKMFAELDFELMAHHAQRLLPSGASRSTHERALVALKGDAFIEAAKQRAAELSHHLAPAQRDRLLGLLKDLSQGRQGEARAAMLARCIMETDERSALRFELLALEGEMEAAAAKRWLDAEGDA